MQYKKGLDSIYLGESEKNFDAIIQFRDYLEGVKEVFHTEVDPKLSGKGVGQSLVEELVKLAREKEFKLYPTCKFAKKILEENIEYEDILYKNKK